MLPATLLEELVQDQRASFLKKDPGVPREVDLERHLKNPWITAVMGVRRCGKSTLLRQVAARLPNHHYVNFGYLEEAYLVFEVPKFDFSLKKSLVREKKICVIDGGMRNAVALSFSRDEGKRLENAIFLELRRRGKEVAFFRERGECDFVVLDRGRASQLFQVCHSLTASNRDREIDGLMEAAESVRLTRGTILTYDQSETLRRGRIAVEVRPAWRWMLGA